jgi:hypothetical protein
VCYAPTHSTELNYEQWSLPQGEDLIAALIDHGFLVIFRPHPVSLVTQDYIYINQIIEKFKNHKNFEFDISESNIRAYSRSSILVTDLSGTAITFAIATFRRVFFINSQQIFLESTDAISEFQIRRTSYEIRELLLKIEDQDLDYCKEISNLRQKIYNCGQSLNKISEMIAECV